MGFGLSDALYFINPLTGARLTDHWSIENDTAYLKSPKVLAYARSHYNCNTLEKFPFENQGG